MSLLESEKRVVIADTNVVLPTPFALQFLEEYDYEFLNADEIAKQLSSENPTEKKISAGKIFFKKLHEAIEKGKSLLIESTLSGHYLQDYFEIWKSRNYQIQIVFIFVDSPEISIARIAERVKKGGHFVPDEDVRRRFVRGQNNFWKIYKNMTDYWVLIYNSDENFQEVAFGEKENFWVIGENVFQLFEGNLNEQTQIKPRNL